MATATVVLPPELAEALRAVGEPLDTVVREVLVLELVRRGVVSSGRAAELLGVSRIAVLERLHAAGIAYLDLNGDDLAAERAVVATLRA